MMGQEVRREEVSSICPEDLNPGSHHHVEPRQESLLDWDRVMELREISQRSIAEADRLRAERDRRGRWRGFGIVFRW
jgi:hypothetical protein